MSLFNTEQYPHIRYNPLKDEWVLVSPHRLKRPWQGQVEKKINITNKSDLNNPLSPNALRSNGIRNPDYSEMYVFDNDFPALFDYNEENDNDNGESPNVESNDPISDLFKSALAKGRCKVMCFHPNSELTLSSMSSDYIVKVITKWIDEFNDLKYKYSWVQIFENKGTLMGCSNPHPHCQIWASNYLPNLIKTKHRTQKDFYSKHNKIMLVEYLKNELKNKKRLVEENSEWAVFVPYWAEWPYETILIPKRHIVRLSDLSFEDIIKLADIMKKLLVKYDNLFQCSFPYSMGFHFAPTGKYLDEDCSFWQLHLCFLPPLLQSASVKKFMAGYELLAQPQRDLTPEKAAEQLRHLVI